ncbi:MAG: glycosyl hydrolase [Chloroflexi bacterium]|nr:glycosyl hydrolase [Chloroflexota bacterium]
MIQRKCFLGTTRGIVAYEAEEGAGGQIRFKRVMEAMPDRFFGPAIVDIDAGLIFAGASPGDWKIDVGSTQQSRPKPDFGPVLYRSADGGQTWEPSDEGITVTGIRTMALDESTGELYAAGDGPATIFRSRDKGENWEELGSLKGDPSANTWLWHPGTEPRGWAYNSSISASHGVIYANIEEGWTYRSDDGGKTWRHLRNGAYVDTHGIRAKPSDPMRVWCTCARGCVNSVDGGETWEYVDHGHSTGREYCTGIAINPSDHNMVVYSSSCSPRIQQTIGGGTIHRTKDDGKTWENLKGGLPFPMQGQVCLIEFDQHNGLYIGTDAGDLYFSPDAGDHFVNVDHRLPIRHSHKNALDAVSMASPSDPTARFFSRQPEPVGV